LIQVGQSLVVGCITATILSARQGPLVFILSVPAAPLVHPGFAFLIRPEFSREIE
jgi:hypothetical protein